MIIYSNEKLSNAENVWDYESNVGRNKNIETN